MTSSGRPPIVEPIRIAAVGDLHVGVADPSVLDVDPAATDLVLIAGDLTRGGTVDEARAAADTLAASGVPTVAVLGNHDHHAGCAEDVRRCLEDRGVVVLEQEAATFRIRGRSVGVVGAKGFGGGFGGASATEFGEREMKEFAATTRRIGTRVGELLDAAGADVRIVVYHYSPVAQTLGSEPAEIYPFLGSSLLAEAVDHHGGADLVVHGHAHRGSEKGRTPGGHVVRNVARPVLRRSHACFEL